MLRPVSQQSPQGCPRNSANICLVEHRSFSTLEGEMYNMTMMKQKKEGRVKKTEDNKEDNKMMKIKNKESTEKNEIEKR